MEYKPGGKHYLLKKWRPPDRYNSENSEAKKVADPKKSKQEGEEKKNIRNQMKKQKSEEKKDSKKTVENIPVDETKTSKDDEQLRTVREIQKERDDTLNETSVDIEKEADSTTDLKDNFILELASRNSEESNSEPGEESSTIKVKEEFKLEGEDKDKKGVESPHVPTPPCITINESSMQIRVSIPGEKSEPPTLSKLETEHEKEIVTLVNKCHSMFSNLMEGDQCSETSNQITAGGAKESRKRKHENDDSNFSLAELELKKRTLLEEIKKLEYQKMKGLEDLQTIRNQKEKFFHDFQKIMLDVGGAGAPSSETPVSCQLSVSAGQHNSSSDLGTLSPPNSIEDRPNSSNIQNTSEKKEETEEKPGVGKRAKVTPDIVVSAAQPANTTERAARSSPQVSSARPHHPLIHVCQALSLQTSPNLIESSAVKTSVKTVSSSQAAGQTSAAGSRSSIASTMSKGSPENCGAYTNRTSPTLNSRNEVETKALEQRQQDLKVLQARAQDPRVLESSMPMLKHVDPKILEMLDPKSLDSKYLYQRIMDARYSEFNMHQHQARIAGEQKHGALSGEALSQMEKQAAELRYANARANAAYRMSSGKSPPIDAHARHHEIAYKRPRMDSHPMMERIVPEGSQVHGGGPLNLQVNPDLAKHAELTKHTAGPPKLESSSGNRDMYLRTKSLEKLNAPHQGVGPSAGAAFDYGQHHQPQLHPQYYQAKYQQQLQSRRENAGMMTGQSSLEAHNHQVLSKPIVTRAVSPGQRHPSPRLPLPHQLHPHHPHHQMYLQQGARLSAESGHSIYRGIYPYDARKVAAGRPEGMGHKSPQPGMSAGKVMYEGGHYMGYHNQPQYSLWKAGGHGQQVAGFSGHQRYPGQHQPANQVQNAMAGSQVVAGKTRGGADLQPVISPKQFSQELPQPTKIKRLSNYNLVPSDKFRFKVPSEGSSSAGVETAASEVAGGGKPAEKKEEESGATKCENCGENAQFMCSNCKASHYCSTKCQRDRWQSHLLVCRVSQGNNN